MGLINDPKHKVRRVYRLALERFKRALAMVNERPVFVLGNQKSGTTAIAVLLGQHTGLSTSLGLTTQHSGRVVDIHRGNAPIDALVQENELEFSRDLIKDSNLTFLYRYLRDRFPEARFAMVVRDPRANVRSILDRLSIPEIERQCGTTNIGGR